MNAIDSEFRQLEDVFSALEIGLAKQRQNLKLSLAPDPGVESEVSSLVTQLVEADNRLARLAHSGMADSLPEYRDLATRAALLQGRAHNLLELIERNAAQCRELKHAAQEALEQLQRGGKYLHSVGGNRENRPQFLDALH